MFIEVCPVFLHIRRRESEVMTMDRVATPMMIQYWGLRPFNFVSHPEEVVSSGSGLLMKSVSFSADLDSSLFCLWIIVIRWCSKIICFVSEGCNATAPQLIFDELMEQVRGKIISAVELNVQSSDIVPFL